MFLYLHTLQMKEKRGHVKDNISFPKKNLSLFLAFMEHCPV